MAKAKVFVVCEPKKRLDDGARVPRMDLTPAAEWGEIVVLLPFSQSGLEINEATGILKDKLVAFSDFDYLVPVGDPVLMCAATTVAAFRNNGRVKLLKWDRLQSSYIPIQLSI